VNVTERGGGGYLIYECYPKPERNRNTKEMKEAYRILKDVMSQREREGFWTL
jgi:hypothetical protein